MFSPSIAVLHAITTGVFNDEVEERLGRPLTEIERDGMLCGEHAGTWETSFMLAQNPALVEEGYQHLAKEQPPPFLPFLAAGNKLIELQEKLGSDTSQTQEMVERLAGGLGWLLNTKRGYGGPAVSYKGIPAAASAEIGEIFRELLARECLRHVEDVTSGRKSAIEVRSIASDTVLIQPNFFANVGIAAAAIVGILAILF